MIIAVRNAYAQHAHAFMLTHPITKKPHDDDDDDNANDVGGCASTCSYV